MQTIDYISIVGFIVLLVSVGVYGYTRVGSSSDFFTAGGKLPWWLTGVSHHVSGYSGAVFVAYASIAYTHGFVVYVWWAMTIAIGMLFTVFFIAPRWARLREKFGVQSPTEYLATRYGIPAQQLIAWTGVIIKIFDVAAKWAAIGILLNAFTGLSITAGIALSGCVTLIYVVLGGVWADVVNDFLSFIIQLASGIIMMVLVLRELGDGVGGFFTLWDRLPAENSQIFREPYTFWFVLAILSINTLTYSGGLWSLAMRFISSPTGKEAKKAALLSSALYLIWPLILFFPMFASPIFFPNLENTEKAYSVMALKFLPPGLLGLMFVSLFSTTLTMTAGDSNTIASVITRDILPTINKRVRNFDRKKLLMLARLTTFTFVLFTVILAFYAESFGGVIGLILSWFAALTGPISIPMILGLLPWFKHSNGTAVWLSIALGLLTFIIMKFCSNVPLALEISGPIITSFIVYAGCGLLTKKRVSEKVDHLLDGLNKD
ncbi:putative symporter YidK [Mycovorax composti]|jgi:Na+/proline symporter|uniref:Symporter YidK n=2 Tax=Chitinophagaceae TaxID=563835 RepID=A0ABZ2ENS0_9BACT